MWKKVILCCGAIVILGNTVPVMAGHLIESVSAPVFKLTVPTVDDAIGNLLLEFRDYAKSMPSINAQNMYDHIKVVRFSAKGKREINACNTLMSYFRLQSNDQSGDVIRKKLKNLSEALVWFERKKAGRLTADRLTDFRIVQYLLNPEVFPHLTLNKMKIVLDIADKFKAEGNQEALIGILVGHGVSVSGELDTHLNYGRDVYRNTRSIENIMDVSTIPADQIDNKIIELENRLSNLKKCTYRAGEVEARYSQMQRKHMTYIITSKIAALILRKNSMESDKDYQEKSAEVMKRLSQVSVK